MKKIRSQTKAQQVQDAIRELMDELDAGDALPSEPKLAAELGVSRFTVSQGICALAAEGLLLRVQGKGTFVAEPVKTEPAPAPQPTLQISAGPSRRLGLVQGLGVGTDNRELFYGSVFTGIQNGFRDAGYTFVHIDSKLPDGDVDRVLGTYAKDQLEGLVLMGRVGQSVLAAVEGKSIPAVVVDNNRDDLHLDSVGTDNVDGGRRATEHLITNGHSNIAFLSTHPETSYAERFDGYMQAMASAAIEIEPDNVIRDLNGPEDARLCDLLDDATRPSAIFAASDHAAAMAARAAYHRGMHVPLDISVIGFDDDLIARRLSPALTTMRIFQTEMGEAAARCLLARLRDGSLPLEHIKMKTELIERESVANFQ